MLVGLVAVAGVWLALRRSAPLAPAPPSTLAAQATAAPEPSATPTAEPEPATGSPVTPQIASLQGADAAQRAAAAEALGRLGPAGREAVPALSQALGDPDVRVAEQAALALGAIRDRSAIGPLASALKRATGGASAPLARAAVRALARLAAVRRDPLITDALLATVQAGTEPSVRSDAAAALASVATDAPGVAATLATVAERDTDERVRKAAADAADRLDPASRRRLAVANWIQKGQQATREGRLVDPREESALTAALRALDVDPQSQDAHSLLEQTLAAIQAEVRSVAKADAQKAAAILDQAIAIDPGRAQLEELRASVAEARTEEERRARVFKLTHKHASKAVLGGVILIGDGRTRGCHGTLELLEDGFRFRTERSDDSRTDNVEFRTAQIKSVRLRENGDQLHIETVSGRFDFYGRSADLRRIQQSLAK